MTDRPRSRRPDDRTRRRPRPAPRHGHDRPDDRARWHDGRLEVEPEAPDADEQFPLLSSPRPVPAGKVLAVMLLGLVLGALLNADRMAERAEQKSFDDPWRGPSTAIWGTLESIADGIGLTTPRRELETALGRTGGEREQLDVADLLGRGRDGDPSPAGAPDAPDATTTTTTTAPPQPELRTPTAAEPLRLYVGGDSIAKNFGLAMQEAAGSTGIITSNIDYRLVTGLTRPDFFNWPQHLADDVVPTDPEVVILLFGANDAQSIQTPDGTICPRFDQCWIDEYRRRVAGTMDLLRDPAGDRLVLWLGQPVPGPDSGVRYLDLFNGIYAEEAATRPWVEYLDTWSWFQTPDRRYAAYLDAADGSEHRVREPDDVHLTLEGGRRLAWAVLRHLGGDAVDLSAWTGTYPVSALPGDQPPRRDGPPTPEPVLVD